MAYRVTTYPQAFGDLLDVRLSEELVNFLKRMEKEGHTERSISFTVWKKQYKLRAFKNDPRFFSVLENEINKWSWKKDDPRWQEYWKRKKEAERAEQIRKEIDNYIVDEKELVLINKRAKKKKQKPEGYVYFLQGQCGGAIKIGYSLDPQKRLKELQTGYPDTLEILLMIPGDENTERTLHRQFEASRLKGEWFRPDDYLIESMKKLKATYNY